MDEPKTILTTAFRHASSTLGKSLIDDQEMRERVEYVACNLKNRASVRLLMACLLAKIHRPQVDVRKPYTSIGGSDSFSGRTYDERYLTPFIRHLLKRNSKIIKGSVIVHILGFCEDFKCWNIRGKLRVVQAIADFSG